MIFYEESTSSGKSLRFPSNPGYILVQGNQPAKGKICLHVIWIPILYRRKDKAFKMYVGQAQPVGEQVHPYYWIHMVGHFFPAKKYG